MGLLLSKGGLADAKHLRGGVGAPSADQVYVDKVSVVLSVFIVAVEVFPLTPLPPLASMARPWKVSWLMMTAG
jgi:hypothetical protein